MIWSLELVLVLFITTLWIHSFNKQLFITSDCWCHDADLCKPLHQGNQAEVEVFAFHLDESDWKHYDWSKITTIVVTMQTGQEAVCTAHANNARIVLKARTLGMSDIKNKRFLRKWITFNANFVKFRHMDGIYLEFQEIVAKGSALYHEVMEFVKEATSHFHQEIPGSQISFRVPWSPNCKNEACHDFLAISQACDILFVASFDIPNDMRDGCVARSSAPYHRVLSGMSDYIKLGIDSRKLVMGVAWYGYDYTCKHFLGVGECELETVTQGVTCSHTGARRIPYKDIMQHLPRSLSGRFWDDDRKAPFYVYLVGNRYHEVWYDDPESISMRMSFVMKLNLRGIGVWAANDINHTGDARTRMQATEMWNAMCPPWWNYRV